MLAQYSTPFSIALALSREARDPESWSEEALADPQIRALCRRVRLVPSTGGEHGGMASAVVIALADGRRFEHRAGSGMLEPGEDRGMLTEIALEQYDARLPRAGLLLAA